MRLSVIIPVWCEAGLVFEAVRAARDIADEVIVVDAQSPDGTAEAARRAGATVVQGVRGRGQQLNAGIEAATGDALLLLHADARLGPGARTAIEQALARADVTAGNFRLRFVPESRWARFFSWANDLRRRWLGVYYGDSAVFVTRDTMAMLGGFRPLPIMEDYEFIRRMERRTETAYISDVVVEVSARRFQGAPLRTMLLWAGLQALYTCGVAPERLASMYADIR